MHLLRRSDRIHQARRCWCSASIRPRPKGEALQDVHSRWGLRLAQIPWNTRRGTVVPPYRSAKRHSIHIRRCRTPKGENSRPGESPRRRQRWVWVWREGGEGGRGEGRDPISHGTVAPYLSNDLVGDQPRI